jgi:hypothetical protein
MIDSVFAQICRLKGGDIEKWQACVLRSRLGMRCEVGGD